MLQEERANSLMIVANNFWGKEDAGVHPMLERMHNAKVTSDELKAFYSGALHHELGLENRAYISK